MEQNITSDDKNNNNSESNETNLKKTYVSYELKISGLSVKQHILEKLDFSGKVIRNFDLRKIKKIVLRQKRAYGCILVPLIFLLCGIFWGNSFLNRTIGLAIAITTSVIGMLIIWIAKEIYNYILEFSYENIKFKYPMIDTEEEICKFIEKLKEFCPKILNLTELSTNNLNGND